MRDSNFSFLKNNPHACKEFRKDSLEGEFVRDFDEKTMEEKSYSTTPAAERVVKTAEEVEYTRKQESAITSKSSKLIIDAGPGAGKTEVLTKRVEYLVKNLKKDPKSVLVITFTEKAANELTLRLKDKLPIEIVDQMKINTIHGFCIDLLNEYVSSGIDLIDDKINVRKLMFIKKYKEELGFTYENHITEGELGIVGEKYKEFISFDVDVEGLHDEIKSKYFTKKNDLKNEEEYMNLINAVKEECGEDFKFPVDMVNEKATLRTRWYLHKYLAILKSFKKYLELQDERTSYDFDYIQLKARDYLKENRNHVRFKNILIDEFQDSDIIQIQIFDLLLEGSETFTIVGDEDQSIYGFRGARPEFFHDFRNNDEFEHVSLDVNFRSAKNIVDFNESFYDPHRTYKRDDGLKIRSNRQEDGNLYYIQNDSQFQQAKEIVSLIKHLKEEGKIEKYSDVGLLFRSLKDYYIAELIKELDDNGIDCYLKGAEDFGNYPEVRAFVVLLGFIADGLDDDYRVSLKEFSDEEMNDEVFKLSHSTIENLGKLEDGFAASCMTHDELLDLGVEEDDCEFFTRLFELKREFYEGEEEYRLSIQDVFYRLFDITNYIDDLIESGQEEHKDDYAQLHNLALISQVINHFMETNDRYDLASFFEFLANFYPSFDSPSDDEISDDRVQITTIHGSKGLEYPVVILCNVRRNSFPREKFTIPSITKDIKYLIESPSTDRLTYPIHVNYLEQYSNLGESYSAIRKLYKRHEIEEQNRLIYVAMTRARDTLIISSVLDKNKKESKMITTFKVDNGLQELDGEKMGHFKASPPKKLNDENELNLSFTSLKDYRTCPHKYNIIYNYGFKTPETLSMHIGTVIHKILDKIHKTHIEGRLSEDIVEQILYEAINSNPDLSGNEQFLNSLNHVRAYADEKLLYFEGHDECDSLTEGSSEGKSNPEWDLKDSEFYFTIQEEDCNLTGQVDLILKDEDGEVTLIDFKTTGEESLDDNFEDHEMQLHIYYLALKDRQEYMDRINNLKVYAVNDNLEQEVDLDPDFAEELKEELSVVSHGIHEKHFDKRIHDDSYQIQCGECVLRHLCNYRNLVSRE